MPIHRPRLFWTNIKEDNVGGLEEIRRERWAELRGSVTYPDTSAWIEPGWTWPGEGEVFPTCMKSIRRDKPPFKPAGPARTDQDCRLRWEADEFGYPPYQYKSPFILWKEGKWRLLSGSERALLHGMGFGHVETCMNASEVKKSWVAFEDCKKTLVGDSFSLYSFVIFAAWAVKKYIPPVSYEHLCSRMGMAPGFCCGINARIPLQRKLAYGSSGSSPVDIEELHRSILKRVNHAGSDVRVSSGHIMDPKAFPRQSVPSAWWQWTPVFQFRFKKPDHINSLELRSIVQAVRWRITHKKEFSCKVFHLTDSYVNMSIIGKGRSSSSMLQFQLRRLMAEVLLCNLYLICVHVGSLDNPTDHASRS